MGANVSASMADDAGSPTGFDDIPENCVAMVMMYLDPPDVCKIARLNRTFRSASSADLVWESKLPTNYRFLLDQVFGDSALFDEFGKKEVFARLSRPNSFDGGTKEIWVDKVSGGVFLSISWRGLRITGIDDRRYWNFIATEESRFQTVAYLQQIWWFELAGEIEFRYPTGTYTVLARLHLGRPSKRLGRRVCSHDHVHGWDAKPVTFQLTTSDGQHEAYQRCLESPGAWVEYRVGSFVVRDPESPMTIRFSVAQIDCTHTKGGVCVDSVLIRPDSVGKEAKLFF